MNQNVHRTTVDVIPVPHEQLWAYCRRNQIQSLALFGSALGEDFRPDSDIDLLVEFEPEARIGFMALGRMQQELAALFGRPVDLVPKAGLKPLIRDQVLTEARTLYATG